MKYVHMCALCCDELCVWCVVCVLCCVCDVLCV